MRDKKLKRCSDGGDPDSTWHSEEDFQPGMLPISNLPNGNLKKNIYNPEPYQLADYRQPGMQVNPNFKPVTSNAAKKSLFGDIGKFIKNNPAETSAIGLGLMNNVLASNAAKQDDTRQAIIHGGSDNLYSTGTGDRGDWTTNEGYFRPDQKTVTQFGALPMAKYGLGAGLTPGSVIPNVESFNSAPSVSSSNIAKPQFEPVDLPPKIKSESSEPSSEDFKNFISQKESGGDYMALPKRKDGSLVSSAVGKYQFLWNKNKDWISNVTGITTKEAFRRNPDAQEKAFTYWDKNVLTPAANKIQEQLGINSPLDIIKSKVHFAGAKGAFDFYKDGKETKDGFGSITSSYKMGGEYEMDSKTLKQFLSSGGEVEYL